MVKLELLDNKHVQVGWENDCHMWKFNLWDLSREIYHHIRLNLPPQDIVFQLRRLMQGLTTFHKECAALMKDAKLFPIEVDLTRNSFQYKSTMPGG